MEYSVIIKDDIERAIEHVFKKNESCAQPLTKMIFDKIHELREEGYNITYLGSVLSNNTDIVITEDDDAGADNERVFFHLMKVDQDGKAIDVAAFIVIDLTDSLVLDCSANIVTVH